ncbi:methyl-accepting chemotaxis protein [Halanaerobacter jeridensis]|uniref:Methyl-accepting chemotaxis protein n=1 Tax=Halanaerobacter jeridensis TaxID=706427 RepID=A0A939BSB4_9FIRM|nr:methyl-accepting chemotaxis protein [Halanaerobacter jeridensis]MBM7556956.1 methyl-accepting chemotaxis protein [Halanaerobacter jeridensis]
MKLKKKVKNWAQNLKDMQISDWLNKITVLRRVQLGFVVVVAILLVFSLLIFINTAQIADELYSLNQTLVPSVKTNTAVTNNLNNKMVSIYKWQANLASYTSSDMLGKELDNLKSYIQQEDVKQRLNKMEQLNAQMKEKVSQLRKTEEGSYENKNLSSQIKDLGTKLKMNNAAISKFGWQQLEQRVNSIDNKAKEIRNTTLLLALISLVFCLLLAFGLYIGINKITTNIKNKSYQAKDKSESIDALSSEIKEIADEVDSKISTASVSIQELVEGNQEVTEAISEVSTGVEELAQQAEEISQIGEETYQFMEETTGKIVQGDELLDTAVKRMKSLKKSINKIGNISNKIMEISEQTNLLALNAAIEAARAGEKGKGFSVVAEEIKELADESKEATLEVQEIIQEIEASTKQTVQVMTAEEGDTENIVSVFNEINYLAQDVAQQMKKVKEAAGNQVASTEQVSALTEQISVSSEEMAAQTETAVSSTKEISNLMGEVTTANQKLYEKVNEQEQNCSQQEELMNLVIEANQKLNKKD